MADLPTRDIVDVEALSEEDLYADAHIADALSDKWGPLIYSIGETRILAHGEIKSDEMLITYMVAAWDIKWDKS